VRWSTADQTSVGVAALSGVGVVVCPAGEQATSAKSDIRHTIATVNELGVLEFMVVK
jgi:hypothetical protein